jgi:hypothetical protein
VAAQRLAKAGLAALLSAVLANPAIGSARGPTNAAADGRAVAVGAALLPANEAGLPGVSPTGGGLAETAREPGRPDGSGGGRRSRERSGLPAALQIDRTEDAVRARARERECLGLASTLHHIAAGHAAFHCDTPPPASA